jgi:hypothetical protein
LKMLANSIIESDEVLLTSYSCQKLSLAYIIKFVI